MPCNVASIVGFLIVIACSVTAVTTRRNATSIAKDGSIQAGHSLVQINNVRETISSDPEPDPPEGEVRIYFDQDGDALPGRIFRPEWTQTLRCSNMTEDSCLPCTDDTNCWTSKNDNRVIEWTAPSDHVRFQNKLLVNCKAPTVKVKFNVLSITNGALHVFWDGEELSHDSKGSSDGGASDFPLEDRTNEYVSRLRVSQDENSHGHIFVLEFRPKDGVTSASAVLSIVRFLMPEDYAICEDSKVCLKILGDMEGGMELRNNNSMQRECLKNPASSSLVCKAWDSCLEASGHKERLLAVLESFGVYDDAAPSMMGAPTELYSSEEDLPPIGSSGSASLLETQSHLQQEKGSESNPHQECFYPPNQDPESWDCDCYDVMMTACKEVRSIYNSSGMGDYTESLCLKAQICSTPNICMNWFNAECENDAVSDMLSHFTPSLLQRVRREVGGSSRGRGKGLCGFLETEELMTTGVTSRKRRSRTRSSKRRDRR